MSSNRAAPGEQLSFALLCARRFVPFSSCLVLAAPLVTFSPTARGAPSQSIPGTSPPPKPAQTPAPPIRRWLLALEVGAGSPVGSLGFIGEFRVMPALAFGAGVGESSVNPTGADGAVYRGGTVFTAFTVLRPIPEGSTPTLRLAYSNGRYSHVSNVGGEYSEYVTEETNPHAGFAQGDVGWEFRWDLAAVLRVSLGAAALLNPGGSTCYEHVYEHSLGPCTPQKSVVIPTFSVMGGVTF